VKHAPTVSVLVHVGERPSRRPRALGCSVFGGALLLGGLLGLLAGNKLLLVWPLALVSVAPAVWMFAEGSFRSAPWHAYPGFITADGALFFDGPRGRRRLTADGYVLSCRVVEGERIVSFLEASGIGNAVLETSGAPGTRLLERIQEDAPMRAVFFARVRGAGCGKAVAVHASALASIWWLVHAMADPQGPIAWMSLFVAPAHALLAVVAGVWSLFGDAPLQECRVSAAGLSVNEQVVAHDELREIVIGARKVSVEHGRVGTKQASLSFELMGGSLSPFLQARLMAAALTSSTRASEAHAGARAGRGSKAGTEERNE
jgi:hypothetical protein